MLLGLREYHRPAQQDQRQGLHRALALLARPGIRTVALAGGDTLLASADPRIEAVVDLQGLDLDTITPGAEPGTHLRIGAMVTRAALAQAEPARTLYQGIVAEVARRWGGSVQRNRATVGGAVATAAANDPLVAALLACDAVVVLESLQGTYEVLIAGFLPHRAELLAVPALITALLLPSHPAGAVGAALATVARTPADAPIVLAAAVLSVVDGRCTRARLALGGVAALPMRVPEVEALLAGQPLTAELIAAAAARAAVAVQPAGDFLGSAEYRRAMAGALTKRALDAALASIK